MIQQNRGGPQKKYTLNLLNSATDYIDRILSEVSGMKCLILDQETIGIISLIYSQSQILKKDVYLMEKIDAAASTKQKLQHMKVIFLIRPTQENQTLLLQEIKDKRFCEYYIFFTNTLSNFYIEQLAEADDSDLIKQLQEIYLDFYIVQPDTFTLNIPSTIPLTKSASQWNSQDEQLFQRVFEGLSATIYSLRRIPMIRYQGSSEICAKLAQKLSQTMREEYEQSQSQFMLSNCLLLILDRREDPATLLLNQWTYQGMLHELIGIQNNRIDIRQGQKALNQAASINKADSENEFVISSTLDDFFAENQYSNFGELAQNIKDFIDKVTQQKKETVQINSLEDMQKAVDKIPEIRKMSGNLSKHVALSCELSKLVEERQLLKVSKVEQDIVCNEAKSEHQKAVFQMLEDRTIQTYEKLKLVMLYALRYENCDKISRMKDILRDLGVKNNSLNLINYLLDYSGKAKRQGDLFSDKNIFSKAQQKFKSVFKDVPNIYTQHQPYFLTILEQILTNKIKDNEFPSTNLNNFRERPTEIIIFYVGGISFEEVKEIGLLNKQSNQPNILLGGTYIHNSRTFLAEICQLSYENNIEVVVDKSNPRNDNKFHKF
ncbi:unnamed protein product [Paramecium primaurelia]|uniref:Vacuolar protein sorting-associated protein 45 n=1 Tax=Paramecium primaurelia TaxID=5886 RepID=A0A8S1P9G3_PARPR|nr:unnamed protein product [Paramecium primaurelia]